MKRKILGMLVFLFSMPAYASVDYINSTDRYGNTILCSAILNGDMMFAKTLIQMGADPNSPCMQKIHFSKIRIQRQNIQEGWYNSHQNQGTQYFSAPVYSNSVVRQKSLSPYISGKLGVSFHRSQLQASYSGMSEKENIKDTAYSGSLAFGAKYKFLRGELEGSYTTKAEEKIGDATAGVQTGSLMMNLYFDIPVSDSFLPYVMLGGGAAYNHVKLEYGNQSVSNHKMNPAWQVGAGISYKVNQKLFTDLGYRYSDYGNVDIIREDGVDYTLDKIKSHSLTLGLRYHL
ncbi:MAG: hypothetical protein E7021_02160 [Alphaproteobacteria bacterium]|nr:hypothetical protein [Alphaproteobacteria bacterium]